MRSKWSSVPSMIISSARVKPPSHHLQFFPDLHIEVLRAFKNPYSAHVHTQATSTCSTMVGMRKYGYEAMPKVKEMFAGYLSPSSASSWRKPALPTKPCRVRSNLVGKAYVAASQDGASLHTMVVLQAYQVDLLKELNHSVGSLSALF